MILPHLQINLPNKKERCAGMTWVEPEENNSMEVSSMFNICIGQIYVFILYVANDKEKKECGTINY